MWATSIHSMAGDNSRLERLIQSCIDVYDHSRPNMLGPFNIGLEILDSGMNSDVRMYFNRRHDVLVLNMDVTSLSILDEPVPGITDSERSIRKMTDALEGLIKSIELLESEEVQESLSEFGMNPNADYYLRLSMDFETYMHIDPNIINGLMGKIDFEQIGVKGIVIHMVPAGMDDQIFRGSRVYYSRDGPIDRDLFHDSTLFIPEFDSQST